MSTSDMDRTTMNIVHAGRIMFGKYGFAKTTMSDIAKQASVSRQTVYNTFSSKDDILRAVISEIGRESLATLEAEWNGQETIEEKLASFQRIGPLSWFKEVRAAPDWADILEGLNTTAAVELAQTERDWVALLNGMLGEQMQGQNDASSSVQDISDFFYSASKNAKYGVDEPEEMRKRLVTILEATMALLKSRGYEGK